MLLMKQWNVCQEANGSYFNVFWKLYPGIDLPNLAANLYCASDKG